MKLPRSEQCSNNEMVDILNSVLFVDSFNYNFPKSCHTTGKMDLGIVSYTVVGFSFTVIEVSLRKPGMAYLSLVVTITV